MPYTVDGLPVDPGQEPQNREGTLWVPLRGLSEMVGARVDWDPDSRVAIVYHNDNMITVKPNDATVDINGEQMELQAAPFLWEGDTLVPVRLFQQALGFNINVNLGTNQVDLTGSQSA
ncbi:MAG: hypothetical protein JWN98_2100 [Abditibacteriota bacterium]|nr:hypothetical protein [Abditibacteriota bacterium]